MQEQSPLLSICVPTFNRADFLRQALGSFVSQINPQISEIVEIIICDNGSTDSTKEVAAEFSTQHDYISYASNDENIGVELNIFKAVERARGEYVWLFGDDDLILAGALEILLPHLKSRQFDFLMTNKTVKNQDLSVTLIAQQNTTEGDIVFSDIKELCCKFGYFTQLGFLSTAIFKRLPFLEVDYTPYLNTYYPQNGVWLEAFSARPCLYVADVLVVHRQQNQRIFNISTFYMTSIYVLRTFKTLVSRNVLDYSIIDRIREQPLEAGNIMPGCSLAEYISFYLVRIIEEGGLITQSEWLDVFEAFFGMGTVKHKEIILQIFADYGLTMALDRVVSAEKTGKQLEADTEMVANEEYHRVGAGKTVNLDSLNRRLILDNDRVQALRNVFECQPRVIQGLTGTEPPTRRGLLGRINAKKDKEREESKALVEELASAIANCNNRSLPALLNVVLSPYLIEENYKGYNIVSYRGKYYALAQTLGGTDLTCTEEKLLRYYQEQGTCFVGNSQFSVKRLVDQRT